MEKYPRVIYNMIISLLRVPLAGGRATRVCLTGLSFVIVCYECQNN